MCRLSFSKTDVFYIVNEECSPQTDFDESAQNSLEKLRCIHCSSFSSGSNNTLVGRSLIHTPNLPSTCNVLMFNITKHVFLRFLQCWINNKHSENGWKFMTMDIQREKLDKMERKNGWKSHICANQLSAFLTIWLYYFWPTDWILWVPASASWAAGCGSPPVKSVSCHEIWRRHKCQCDGVAKIWKQNIPWNMKKIWKWQYEETAKSDTPVPRETEGCLYPKLYF